MSIPTKLLPLVREAIHFDALCARAKDEVTTYASQTWSDTGEHDPGVTLLEGFCYNVSDLAYRSTLPLTDLLTPPVAEQSAGDGIFPAAFGPQMALTSGPITADDYRRALLDLTDSTNSYYLFRNVQLVPLEPSDYSYYYDTYARTFSFVESEQTDGKAPISMGLRGNYTLYVELSREASESTAKTILEDFLTDNRNLGEAVTHINWLPGSALDLSLTVELEEDVQDIAQVYADIYQACEALFSPKAERILASDLAKQGISNEDIYLGPDLLHGWITKLPPEVDYTAPPIIDASYLPNTLLAVKGIKSVQSFSYKNDYGTTPGYIPRLWWSPPIKYMLDDSRNKVILLTAGGERVTASQADIEAKIPPVQVINNSPVVLPYGKWRDTAQYHPVSDKIPPCYELQQLPVAGTLPEQLYQFMLPFEQALANGCQQLAMLPQLLSFERSGSTVWGQQWPYAAGSIGDQVHSPYSTSLKTLTLANADDYDQELAILNHLLGYFGTQRASRMLSTNADDFLSIEQAYLGQITDLAYHRDNIRVDQVSALQKRIAARLGMGPELFGEHVDMGTLPFYLVEHRALLPVKPSSDYDGEQFPNQIAVSDDQLALVVTQTTLSLVNLLAGQLIDMVLVGGIPESGANGDGDYRLRGLLVDSVDSSAGTFTLVLADNPQLQTLMEDVIAAQSTADVYWQNSPLWLEDLNYPLSYADDQSGVAAGNKVLTVADTLPFPALIQPGDTLTLFSISTDTTILADVLYVDDIAGTLTVQVVKDSLNPLPDDDVQADYYWYPQYAADRFSFIVSLVLNKAMLPASGDIHSTELWIKECVQAELPMHVALMIHWLEDESTNTTDARSFQNFAQTYASWQNRGTAPSGATYQLLWMLGLGMQPARMIGIGAMIIASDEQRTEVIGPDGTEWNSQVISDDSLLFIPKAYIPMA